MSNVLPGSWKERSNWFKKLLYPRLWQLRTLSKLSRWEARGETLDFVKNFVRMCAYDFEFVKERFRCGFSGIAHDDYDPSIAFGELVEEFDVLWPPVPVDKI